MATESDMQSELRERPIGEVAKELTSDLSLLVRQEIELAKAEMAREGTDGGAGAGDVRRGGSRRTLRRGRADGVSACSSSRSSWPSGRRR